MKISINKLSDGRIASVSYGNIIIYKKSDLNDLERGIAQICKKYSELGIQKIPLCGTWVQIGTLVIKQQSDNLYIINDEPISAENLQKLIDVARKEL